jgi:hypothetical protein
MRQMFRPEIPSRNSEILAKNKNKNSQKFSKFCGIRLVHFSNSPNVKYEYRVLSNQTQARPAKERSLVAGFLHQK